MQRRAKPIRSHGVGQRMQRQESLAVYERVRDGLPREVDESMIRPGFSNGEIAQCALLVRVTRIADSAKGLSSWASFQSLDDVECTRLGEAFTEQVTPLGTRDDDLIPPPLVADLV